MVKRFVIPFAASGDKTVTPDATDPGGAISYSQGWPAAYQLPDTDPNYRPVGRQEMNGVFNDVTGAIAELQTQGVPSWVAVAGLVQPYAINAIVRHANAVWQSQIANNSDTPGATANWKNISLPADGRLLNIRTFAASGVYNETPGTKFIVIDLQGAGGGGGASTAQNATNVAAATGGAGGGFVRTKLTSGFSGVAFTVGSGGAGGVIGVSGGNGLPGGATVFGVASAGGGDGGLTSGGLTPPYVLCKGVTATSSGGNLINAAGAPPGDGLALSTVSAISGRGGVSFYGAGAPSVVGTNTNGVAATVPGTGGSGSLTMPSGATRQGGNGAAGLLTIYEFGGV